MSNEELRALAEKVIEAKQRLKDVFQSEWRDKLLEDKDKADIAFRHDASPEAIIALLDKVDQLRIELDAMLFQRDILMAERETLNLGLTRRE